MTLEIARYAVDGKYAAHHDFTMSPHLLLNNLAELPDIPEIAISSQSMDWARDYVETGSRLILFHDVADLVPINFPKAVQILKERLGGVTLASYDESLMTS